MLGTKCGKLLIYDVARNQYTHSKRLIYTRRCNPRFHSIEGGIRVIKVNQSRTLLATCGLDLDQIAVYKLPSLEPYAVTINFHQWRFFDMYWITDSLLMVASKDNHISIWDFNEDDLEHKYGCTSLTCNVGPEENTCCRNYYQVERCEKHGSLEHVRCLTSDGHTEYALTSDSELFTLDTRHRKIQTHSLVDLCTLIEPRCMNYNANHGFIAIGAMHEIVFHDPRLPVARLAKVSAIYTFVFRCTVSQVACCKTCHKSLDILLTLNVMSKKIV